MSSSAVPASSNGALRLDNGPVEVLLPGGKSLLRTDGTAFLVDVCDAYFELAEVLASLPPERTNLDYLRAVVAMVAQHYGVHLTMGQADSFSDAVGIAYNAKKNARLASMPFTPTLRSSSGDSTPSG